MASSDPKRHGRIHKALGSLSGSMLAGSVTNFLQSVATSGWGAAAGALDPVTAGAVLATSAVFGISHACEGTAEKKKAGELADEFAKLASQHGNALDLLKKIADGEVGVELNWFGVQEVAERTTAMISGRLEEQFATVLESRETDFATLGSRLSELNKKLDAVAQVQVSASGTGAVAFGGGIVIEKAETVIVSSPGSVPTEATIAQSTGRLFVELDGDFGAFDSDQRRILQFGLAAFLGLDPSSVRITRVDPGSIRITLEIPASSVPLLLEAFRLGTLADYVKPLVVTDMSEREETLKRRPEMPTTPRRAVILTALGLEFSAVCEFLVDSVEEVGPSRAVYRRGAFGKGLTAWSVLVAETGTGNVQAALHAEAAITHFKPDVLLFVGVAGGLKDVKLGDVVASTKVYGYESGKQKAEFLPRPTIASPAFALEQRARAAARDRTWISRLADSGMRVDAYVGAIAAGEKVLASTRSKLYRFLKGTYGDALAVEMEGYGCLAAAHRHPGVEALVIRGISDHIGGKARADAAGSQVIAARHASAFAFEVLAGLAGARSEMPRRSGSSTESSPSVSVPTGHLSVTGPYLFGRDANPKDLDGVDQRGFDVFLCHNSDDKVDVRRLNATLKKQGIATWLDEEQVPPGRTWMDELEQIVKSCRSAVVCVGPNGIGPWHDVEMKALLTRFVKQEKRGDGNLLPVIPVLLPKAPANVELPLFLKSFSWVDLRGGLRKAGIDKLIWGITGQRP